MAGTKRSIAYLETKFETGDIPAQVDFYDWLASFRHLDAALVPREAVALAASTITLNMNSLDQKKFYTVAAIGIDIVLAITNITLFEVLTWDFEVSTTVNITMPVAPDTIMPVDSGDAWTGGVLTLAAGKYSLSVTYNGTEYRALVSPPFST